MPIHTKPTNSEIQLRYIVGSLSAIKKAIVRNVPPEIKKNKIKYTQD